jgi:membrane protease YdiL (CAAX protease family)
VFFYVIIAAAAGEPVYRARTTDPLSLRTAFTRPAASSRRFYRSVIVGYGFAAAHVAFLVAFYLVGRRFGAWSPQDVQYSDLLSTAMPWIYPVTIASMAATAEEFWFRLLAIPVLARVLRVRWLAVIIPAFIWGFLHANYPQQPAWIRGVEVGLIGVAAGFIMLRFGILATLVWHYTVDALLIGGYLFEAPSWYFRLNGALVVLAVLAPLIVSAAFYRRNHGFVELETAEAAAEEETPAAVAADERVDAVAPVWTPQRLYIAALVTALLGLFAAPTVFGNWIRIRLNRADAETIARREVPNAGQWRSATDFIPNLDPAEFEYLRRAAGTDTAQSIVEERKPTAVWRVRFFRPLEKEEWRIYIDQSGAVVRKDHILDERAPGDSLPSETALGRAKSVLPSASLALVDSSEEKREKRTDWFFVFEDPTFHIGEARARASLELHGSEPSNFRRFLKLPEEWLREFNKPALRQFAVPAFIGALGMPLLFLFMRRLGAHETVFHWRAYALVTGAALVCSVFSGVNQWAAAMSGYDTATPEQNYVTQLLLGRVIMTLAVCVAVFGLALAADVFRQAAFGRAALNRPSLTRAIAVTVLVAGAARVIGWLLDRVRGPRLSVAVWNAVGLDTWLPGLAVLAQAYLWGIALVCVLALVAFASLRYMRPRRRLETAALLIGAVAISRSLTIVQFIAWAAAVAVWLALVILIVRTCSADLIGLGVAVFWLIGLPEAYRLIQQPSPFMRANGVAAALIAALAGISLILAARRAAPSPPSP